MTAETAKEPSKGRQSNHSRTPLKPDAQEESVASRCRPADPNRRKARTRRQLILKIFYHCGDGSAMRGRALPTARNLSQHREILNDEVALYAWTFLSLLLSGSRRRDIVAMSGYIHVLPLAAAA